jgi:uncharacterized protein (DUF1015 family)
MKIYPFHAIVPNLDNSDYSADFFETVKFRYQDYAAEKLFIPSSGGDGLYIYQIKSESGKKHIGVVACVDIQDYEKGIIKQHEKTILSNEDTQVALLKLRGASIKPVLLSYKSVEEIEKWLETYIDGHKKLYVMEFGEEKHRFWKVSEPTDMAALQGLFEKHLPAAYIADGHHRSASVSLLHKQAKTTETGQLMTAFFGSKALEIKAFHRLVRELNGLTADAFLEVLRTVFKVKILKQAALPYSKFSFTMLLDGKWFELIWRKSALKGYPEDYVLLDADLLAEKILKPVLGIKNMRADSQLTYLDGRKSLEDIEKLTPKTGVTFCLFPLEFEDIQNIADLKGTLPPKSTFFEPRMRNGLLIKEI